jgi:wyosine [tRNA(Phe)-imidazoG37] synthetase (radical SAM superfamily)
MDLNSLHEILHQPRTFLGNQFVYAVISQRAGGLSVGINMNPDQKCNFDCVYCEVKRSKNLNGIQKVDIPVMSSELKKFLGIIQLGKVHEFPEFKNIPEDLLMLKNVALSGEGEPTFCANFTEVVDEVLQIRKEPQFPSFKLVLITNGTGLYSEAVQQGLQKFSPRDEIWVKLDAGTQEYMWYVNKTRFSLDALLTNITNLGRVRPIVIQSLFCSIEGEGPSDAEIEAYVGRLKDLKGEGTKISLVQIYSTSRPPAHLGSEHLSLKRLSWIGQKVRTATGLKVEVY